MVVDYTATPVVQNEDYYPFGLTFNSYQREETVGQAYKYNGKEEQNLTGWLDYGARMYDASMGRFFKPDNFGEAYYLVSNYCYVGNNPTNTIDPDGNLILFVNGLTRNGFNISNMPSVEKYWSKKVIASAKELLSGSSEAPAKFVNGEGGPVSSARLRYKAGKKYAADNFNAIVKAYLNELEDNENATIDIVTHSQGGAFGEGIADYFSKTKYKINIIINLQPSGSGSILSKSGTANLRIGVYTKGDFAANKFGGRFTNENIRIIESRDLKISSKPRTKHEIYYNPGVFSEAGGSDLVKNYAGAYGQSIPEAHGLRNKRQNSTFDSISAGIVGYNLFGTNGTSGSTKSKKWKCVNSEGKKVNCF